LRVIWPLTPRPLPLRGPRQHRRRVGSVRSHTKQCENRHLPSLRWGDFFLIVLFSCPFPDFFSTNTLQKKLFKSPRFFGVELWWGGGAPPPFGGGKIRISLIFLKIYLYPAPFLLFFFFFFPFFPLLFSRPFIFCCIFFSMLLPIWHFPRHTNATISTLRKPYHAFPLSIPSLLAYGIGTLTRNTLQRLRRLTHQPARTLTLSLSPAPPGRTTQSISHTARPTLGVWAVQAAHSLSINTKSSRSKPPKPA